MTKKRFFVLAAMAIAASIAPLAQGDERANTTLTKPSSFSSWETFDEASSQPLNGLPLEPDMLSHAISKSAHHANHFNLPNEQTLLSVQDVLGLQAAPAISAPVQETYRGTERPSWAVFDDFSKEERVNTPPATVNSSVAAWGTSAFSIAFGGLMLVAAACLKLVLFVGAVVQPNHANLYHSLLDFFS